MNTVAIVGVGLIGGSFGLALKKAGFPGRILGVSRREAIEKALESGAIDDGAVLEDAISQADLVYLSQPISGILSTLRQLPAWIRPHALVTDAGSTKTVIVEAAREAMMTCQFLGGHPLAGKETRGVESASANLFEDRAYVLTPLQESELETSVTVDFIRWLNKMGAAPIVMHPKEHDRTLAFTSHLPQLASTALSALMHSTENDVQDAFGPALLDSTRLALSPYEIWKDILETNQPQVLVALDKYIATLQSVRASLEGEGLHGYFLDGAEFAGKIRGRRPPARDKG